jgi:solute:Na+ symporter, SSS family
MAVALVVSLTLQLGFGYNSDNPIDFAWLMIITVAITTVAWLVVTFATQPERQDVLIAFYRRTRPSRMGWAPIADLAPDVTPSGGGLSNLLCWVGGLMLIYGTLFGVGKLILNEVKEGVVLLAVAIAGLVIIYRDLSRRGWSAVVD